MIDFLEGYKGIPWSEVVQGVAYNETEGDGKRLEERVIFNEIHELSVLKAMYREVCLSVTRFSYEPRI